MTFSKTTMVAIALSAMVATAFASTAEAAPKVGFPTPITQLPNPGVYIPPVLNPPVVIEDPVIQYPFGKKPNGSTPDDTPSSADVPKLNLTLECKVADAEGNLWLLNFGSQEIPNGIKVRFSVPSSGDHGAFQLLRSIEPGKSLKIADLLHGAEEGAPCRVQVIR